jgi:hypothetical protein
LRELARVDVGDPGLQVPLVDVPDLGHGGVVWLLA